MSLWTAAAARGTRLFPHHVRSAELGRRVHCSAYNAAYFVRTAASLIPLNGAPGEHAPRVVVQLEGPEGGLAPEKAATAAPTPPRVISRESRPYGMPDARGETISWTFSQERTASPTCRGFRALCHIDTKPCALMFFTPYVCVSFPDSLHRTPFAQHAAAEAVYFTCTSVKIRLRLPYACALP